MFFEKQRDQNKTVLLKTGQNFVPFAVYWD